MLSVNELSIGFVNGFENSIVVNGISFSVSRGEVLGIVGESGSGKTVTALSILRLLPEGGSIRNGSITLSDKNGTTALTDLPEFQMRKWRGRKIAMIFQEPMSSLNPVMRCGEQVTEALIAHKGITFQEAKKITLDLFRRVKLDRPDLAFDAFPHQLSGGQKQRIMIAMAISCDPEFLIADEPTSSLDTTIQAEIIELLRELQSDRDMGLIFISHDLNLVSAISDRVLVMKNGNVVESGRTEKIFHEPEHPYTRALLNCRPPLHLRYKKLPVISDYENSDRSFEPIIVTESERATHIEKIITVDPILRVEGLTVNYPVQRGLFSPVKEFIPAVDNVSFHLHKGETLGLIGESGSGKSTLGKTLLRLIEPTAGKVIFRGVDLAVMSAKSLRSMRKNIQLVFQDPFSSLNPKLTIGEAIFEPMDAHDLHGTDSNRRKKVQELLERVGLKAEHYYRYPHQLSGGQRQRVCIARALAPEPELIVCDECVSALDVSVQAQILNLLNELKTENDLSFLFISHDLSLVKFMSDRILVMDKGKIVEQGEADKLYSHPGTDITRKLIKAVTFDTPLSTKRSHY